MRRSLLVALPLAAAGCGFVAGVDFFGLERADDLADAATGSGDASAEAAVVPDAARPHRILVVGGTPEPSELPATGTSFMADILADGSLGPWTAGPDLPAARLYAPAVAGPDFVALSGGITRGPGERGSFLVGRVTDGVVAAWLESSDAFSKRSRAGAIRHGATVFVLGGQDAMGHVLADVEKGVVGPSSVGAFTAGPSLPTPLARAAATSDDQDAFLVGGDDGTGGRTAIFRARFAGDELAAFSVAGQLPIARVWVQAVAHPRSLIVLGGDSGGSALAEVLVYPRNADGTLGAGVTTAPLPTGVSKHQAVLDGDRVYVIGGSALGGTSAAVQIGELTPEGFVSSWRKGTPLPEPRNFHAAIRL